MKLIRRDPSPKEEEWPDDHQQREHRIEKCEDWELSPEDATASVDFKRFGRGTERRSDFYVEVSWIDVRALIRNFIEMGHPEALYLQSVLQLAKAFASNDLPDEDFWQIMPEANSG